MNRKIRLSALALVLALLLSTVAGAAYAPSEPRVLGVATVLVSGQRLRTEPTDSAQARTAVNAGTPVLILEQTGSWYLACYDGEIGYIPAEYLSFGTVSAIDLGTGYIRYDQVNVRTQPSTAGEIAATLRSGTAVNVTGICNGWYRIADATEADIGFVRSDLLVLETMPKDSDEKLLLDTGDLSENELSTIYVTRTADDEIVLVTGEAESTITAGDTVTDEAVSLINYAFTFIGTPYVWGANGPSSFDCSGFVKYVYAHFGYSMHRVANDMLYNDGVWVERADLRPGDVIFFGNTYASSETATHVGIYIGDGQFVHASSSRGVTVSSLDSTYYSPRFVGAKRLIGQ